MSMSGFADQIAGNLGRSGVIDLRRLFVDVISPVDKPFVPRPDHPDHSSATPPTLSRAESRSTARRSMRAQVGELGFEHDAHRAVYVI